MELKPEQKLTSVLPSLHLTKFYRFLLGSDQNLPFGVTCHHLPFPPVLRTYCARITWADCEPVWGWGLKACISDKLCDGGHGAGASATLWAARVCLPPKPTCWLSPVHTLHFVMSSWCFLHPEFFLPHICLQSKLWFSLDTQIKVYFHYKS